MTDPTKFDPQVLHERQMKLAMASAKHLKLWMRESGRTWIVINSDELVDALPWPGGVQEVMDLITLLAQHRSTKPSGRFSKVKDPLTGEMVEVSIQKSEAMEPDELDRAIRFLVAEMRKHKPAWSLDDSAL